MSAMYSYITTSFKASMVTQSLVCNFTGAKDRNLIITKGNQMEIHVLQSEGLLPITTVPFYGSVVSINAFKPSSSATEDVLFVLTERKHFCVLGWDPTTSNVITRATGNFRDRGRPMERVDVSFVDPGNRMIGMLLFEGFIKVLPIEDNKLKEAFNVRLETSKKLLDVQLLHCTARPTLCTLYEDSHGNRFISTHVIDMKEKDIIDGPWKFRNVELSSRIMIACPAPIGGVILIGDTRVTYFNYVDGKSITEVASVPAAQIVSYGILDPNGSRYLLGDIKGSLYVLVLGIDSNYIVTNVVIDYVGSTNIASSISYLDNGVVYIGSKHGDSQIIKLSSTDASGNCVHVLDSCTNIGPILDMALVQSEKQGYQQIVTCSGALANGSLRIIKSGIGMNLQAAIDVEGVKGMWSLRTSETCMFDKYLVQTFISETRILGIDNEEMSEAEIPGFLCDKSTLYCGNVHGNRLVQVVDCSVRLVDSTTLELVQELNVSPKCINLATGNLHQLVVCISGGEVVYYALNESNVYIQQTVAQLDQDIACVSIRSTTSLSSGAADSMDADNNAHNSLVARYGISDSKLLAVGMWTDNTVRLLSIPSLTEVLRVDLEVDTQARDIMLVSFDDVNSYLFIGFGDGSMNTYNVANVAGEVTLSCKRKVVVGSRPLYFKPFVSDGKLCVFVCTDRPTIIYSKKEGKLAFSTVNSDEITAMSPFDSELFPSCFALSSVSNLTICTIDNVQKIHVDTYNLGESPRRIIHHAASSIYVVLSEKIVKTDRGDELVNRILFFNDNSMDLLHFVELDRLETGVSLCCCTFKDSSAESIVVGTSYNLPDDIEPSKGRILVFDINPSDKRVTMTVTLDVKGGVLAVAPIHGKIVAGIGSTIQLFALSSGSDSAMEVGDKPAELNNAYLPCTLVHEFTHSGYILALFVKVKGDHILVGDILRSLTLLKYNEVDGSKCVLEEIARDYASNTMRACAIMHKEGHYIGAEDFGNIFILNDQSSPGQEPKSKLATSGEYHLSDHINVFCASTHNESQLESADPDLMDSAVNVRVNQRKYNSIFFGTVNGAIGAIIMLNETMFKFFTVVEKCMKSMLGSISGLSHEDSRMFQNNRRSSPKKNFIDGDLVERFLDLSHEDMQAAMKIINSELAEINSSNKSAVDASTSTSIGISSGTVLFGVNGADSFVPLTLDQCISRIEEVKKTW